MSEFKSRAEQRRFEFFKQNLTKEEDTMDSDTYQRMQQLAKTMGVELPPEEEMQARFNRVMSAYNNMMLELNYDFLCIGPEDLNDARSMAVSLINLSNKEFQEMAVAILFLAKHLVATHRMLQEIKPIHKLAGQLGDTTDDS